MFSGIVEKLGEVIEIEIEGTNKNFTISTPISTEVYIDQSIAHNGVCLTVTEMNERQFKVTAIHETLIKTNLNHWKKGDLINLERSVFANSRIDGHFVQGHVDTTAECTKIENVEGSWNFHFKIDASFQKFIVDKGSICINGVSLTVVEAKDDRFSVSIIPYTFENTNFKTLHIADLVNIEFDILGKYIVKYLDKINKV